MRRTLALISALTLAAAARAAEPEDDALVCAPTLAETAAAIRAVPGLALSPTEEGRDFTSFRHDPTGTLYTFTLPGAPGHPAVLKRKMVPIENGAALLLSACGYGDDQAGFEALKRGFGARD
ncbi:hypothetical protein [Phenylobacterium sp.]|uniref:hypothetical protein n=1 Tax=Phenylobacterium sp. TaxID=1871053 RepID=UPI0030F381DC